MLDFVGNLSIGLNSGGSATCVSGNKTHFVFRHIVAKGQQSLHLAPEGSIQCALNSKLIQFGLTDAENDAKLGFFRLLLRFEQNM